MGLRIWSFKIKGFEKTLNIKAKKQTAENISREILEAFRVDEHLKQLSGVIGVDEHESNVWTLFTKNTVLSPSEWQKELSGLVESLPDVMTVNEVKPYWETARGIYNKHLPIEDTRVSPEEHTTETKERDAAMKATEERLAKEKAEFLNTFSNGQKVKAPAGMYPVLIKTSYNDSDSMTDYFDNHHGFGETMVLGFVKTQVRREDIHRRFVAMYPDLSKLEWNFEKQEYSMGHGTFLESEYTEHTAPRTTYGGYDKPRLKFEIMINTWATLGTEYYCFKGYPGTKAETEKPALNGKTEVKHNESKNGIEIHFADKPAAEILTDLKENKWRWSRRNKCWYKRFTEFDLRFAQAIIELVS